MFTYNTDVIASMALTTKVLNYPLKKFNKAVDYVTKTSAKF
jgi:hypothetical protein